MELVTLGESVKFKKTYLDSGGLLFDPEEVFFRVYRVVNIPTFGPLTYQSGEGEIERTGVGLYEVMLTIPRSMMPGIYTAEWNGTYNEEVIIAEILDEGDSGSTDPDVIIDSGDSVDQVFETTYDGTFSKIISAFSRTEFQIVEQAPERSTLLDPGRVYGVMNAAPSFNDMGLGLTSQLCIVGHCSGLSLNDPFQVYNIQEAINTIGANQYSPMVRYLLEAYNAGARDIWIMPSAPEGEYIAWNPNEPLDRFYPRAEFDGRSFYEQYEERYLETMKVLAEHEFPDIVVAPDAPFYNSGGIDFLTPLVDSCVEGFLNTGRFRFGFIGTAMGADFTNDDLDNVENDPRLDSYGQDGKTVGIFLGEGTVNTPNLTNGYVNTCVNIVAATVAATPFYSSICYSPLKGLVSPIGKDLSKDRIKSLANKKINPIIRTTKAKRGSPYNSVVASDNLLAVDGSDFWAMSQMSLVQEVIKVVRGLSLNKLGTIEYRVFKREVSDYLTDLVKSNRIRDYELVIDRKRPNSDPHTVSVEIILKAFGAVREIFFSVEVGGGTAVDNRLRNTV